MDVAEAAARDWNVERLDVHVPVNFATLAGEAGTCPGSDVGCRRSPDKPRKNHTFSCTNTWMGDAVQFFENNLLERNWNYWPENASRDVSQQGVTFHVPRDDGEAAGRT